MASKVAEAYVEVRADTRRVGKDLVRAKPVMMRAMQGLSRSFGSSFGQIVIGGMLIGAARASVKAAGIQQAAEAQLQQTLKSTGNAVGLSLDQLKKHATFLQKNGIFGDEETLRMMSQLATFTNITGQEFLDASTIIEDLAVKMGGDLKGSMLLVAKAMDEPITGLTMMRRVGVSFSEQEKAVIKRLAETGHMAEAQRKILSLLARQMGGANAAEAQTFNGQMVQAKNALGDVMEVIGVQLMPVIIDFAKMLKVGAEMFQEIDKATGGAASKILLAAAAVGVLTIAFRAMAGALASTGFGAIIVLVGVLIGLAIQFQDAWLPVVKKWWKHLKIVIGILNPIIGAIMLINKLFGTQADVAKAEEVQAGLKAAEEGKAASAAPTMGAKPIEPAGQQAASGEAHAIKATFVGLEELSKTIQEKMLGDDDKTMAKQQAGDIADLKELTQEQLDVMKQNMNPAMTQGLSAVGVS